METHPKVNAPVSVRGKDDRFTVFSVYEKRKTADLKAIRAPGSPAYLLQDVAWTDISYLEETSDPATYAGDAGAHEMSHSDK